MIELRLLKECNYKCVFCHIPHLKPVFLSLKNIIKIIYSIDNNEPHMFTITWWEPTLYSWLSWIIKYIKKRNQGNKVILLTNWFKFENESYLKKLYVNWLTASSVSFHSYDKNTFNLITWVDWWFDKTIKWLSFLKKNNFLFETSFVICKYNSHQIYDTMNFLIKNTNFSWVTIANIFDNINYRKKEDFHINYKDTQVELIKGLELLKTNNINITTCWIPMCYLKWFEESYMLWQYEENRNYKKSDECKKCVFNEVCRWFIWEYVDFFGMNEYKPVLKCDNDLLKRLKYNKSNFLKEEIKIFNNSTL